MNVIMIFFIKIHILIEYFGLGLQLV